MKKRKIEQKRLTIVEAEVERMRQALWIPGSAQARPYHFELLKGLNNQGDRR
jgi:hypothetical protein